MAFLNDHTTAEERKLLESFKDDPKTTSAREFDKNPFNFAGEITYWTVDRARGCALIGNGIIDRENPQEGENFIFLPRMIAREFCINLYIECHGYFENDEDELKAKYEVEEISKWTILKMEENANLNLSSEEILSALADALSAYDTFGSPKLDPNPQRCKAIVEYNGEIYGK